MINVAIEKISRKERLITNRSLGTSDDDKDGMVTQSVRWWNLSGLGGG